MPRLLARRRRLRVAVPSQLMHYSPRTGHGRVWRRVLASLADRVALEAAEMRPISSAGIRADVWLADGHAGSLDVVEPVVVAVHEVGWTTPDLRRFLDPSTVGGLAAGTSAGVGGAAHVLVPSDWTRKQVLEAFDVGADRVHTVPYGVDLDVFRPGLAGGRARVGAATSMDSPAYVLFVGSLNPRKNIAAVRHAVARLPGHGLGHVLALVTADAPDHDDSSELRRRAESELPEAPGRIVSVPGGDDPDLATLMAGADAVCMPSFSEGFGLPALEAMACGVPVIVSDRGALPEVAGGGGMIVAPTAAAVEEALVRVLSDAATASRLRAAARARAEGFAWERTVAGWLGVLERAAAEAS